MSFALRHNVCATDTQDGMVLLDEITGRYWQLNSTAAFILRTLIEGATPQDTARRLGELYPQLAAERSDGDTASFVSSLLEANLVVST